MENNDILSIENDLSIEEGVDFFENAKQFFIKNYKFAYENEKGEEETSLSYNERIREEATELDAEREKLYQAMISIFNNLDDITQKKVTQEAGIDLSDIPSITLFKEDEMYSDKQYIEDNDNEIINENSNDDMFYNG